MPQVNLEKLASVSQSLSEEIYTHCRPIKLKVKRAIRMDSVDPLMDGVPAHDAA